MKSAGEESQHLEVRGVGKKVRGEDALRPVARSRQPPDVPGEGGRVAGHVDQMGRSQRRDESQSGGMKAVPGRIEDDEVGPGEVRAFEDFFHQPGDEADIP